MASVFSFNNDYHYAFCLSCSREHYVCGASAFRFYIAKRWYALDCSHLHHSSYNTLTFSICKKEIPMTNQNGALLEPVAEDNQNTTPAQAELLKRGLAQMLKGGVIMDVVTPDHARIAEDAGACAVMALERVPADIRKEGGVARMSDPDMIEGIMQAVSIPVMAKCRIGHYVEAQILEALGVDYIDESEVLTPADEVHHVNKHKFKVPFVCGCRNLGEALRRIGEGAAMIRTKGEAGTGDVVEAVRHARQVHAEIRRLTTMDEDELFTYAKEIGAPYALVAETAALGRLPVVNFAAGGVATPADAALMMQLGVDGVFVGSGIFKSGDPAKRAAAIVKATTHFNDPEILVEASRNLGEAMVGINVSSLPDAERMAGRGW
jgi:pyridoxal 5'-phosphate synthase pdxS subunit